MNITEVRKQIRALKDAMPDFAEGSFSQGFIIAMEIVDGYLADAEYEKQLEEELEK